MSLSLMFKAGEVMDLPFRLTLPSVISRSASRREHTPARAITLAMRSPSLGEGLWLFSAFLGAEVRVKIFAFLFCANVDKMIV